MSTKDKYILALEYAKARIEFTFQELNDHLKLNQVESEQFARQIHSGLIFQHNHVDYINNYKKHVIKLYFTVEDKFRLLSYDSLEEARQSSKEAKESAKSATYYAVAALVVSIISFVSSSVFSYIQINSEVNHPKSLISSIKNIEASSKNTMEETAQISQQLKQTIAKKIRGSH